jgi:hypothetical protein
MPHEDDTEDLDAEAGDAEGYNHHHSKMWNNIVDKKAQELQDMMDK